MERPAQRDVVRLTSGWLHCWQAGDAGPWLVLLHQSGSGHSARSWLPTMALLQDRYRLIAFDTPGFGDSPPPAEYWPIERYAAAIIEALDVLGIDRCVVAGDHTGVSIAIAMAAAWPDRVQALVGVGVALWDAELRAGMRQRADAAPPKPPMPADGSHLTDLWNRVQRLNPELPPETTQIIVVDALKATDTASMHAPLHRYDIHADIARVRCPALLLAPSGDVLAGFTAPAAALFADGEAAAPIDGGGAILFSRPDWIAGSMGGFLERRGLS